MAAWSCCPAPAATFNIANGDVAALKAAITTSNSNGQDDTIELATNGLYTLTAPASGLNGLPQVAADPGYTLTIHGNGATIRRSPAAGAPEFRIFFFNVGSRASVTGLTMLNGSVGSTGTPSPDAGGGGILVDRGRVTMDDCTVSGCTSQYGAALLVRSRTVGNDVSVEISGCTFNDNRYAAIVAFGEGGYGHVSIVNSTIDAGSWTAISNQVPPGIDDALFMNLRNVTIRKSGPGVAVENLGLYAWLTIGNTLLDVASDSTSIYNSGNVQSLGYNLTSDNGGGVLNGPHDRLNTPAQLDTSGGLQNRGGPTKTYPLLPGSPAIDAGSGVADAGTIGLGHGTDQRGLPRASGAGMDIGAYEFIPEPSDFDRNGTPDLVLVNAAASQTVVDSLRGGTFLRADSGPGLPPGWQLVKVADFDRDGKPDYFLYHPVTGALQVWLLNGRTLIRGAILPALPPGWRLAAVADIDRDGQLDLVLVNATSGSLVAWLLDGATLKNATYFTTQASAVMMLPAGWKLAGVIDMSGGGTPDLVLYHPPTGRTVIRYFLGAKQIGEAAGPTITAGWTLAGVADFTADGKPDFLIANPHTGKLGIWTLSGNAFVKASYVVDAAGVPITQSSAVWTIVAP